MCWLTLAVLCILIRENDRLAKQEKRLYYLSYALIAAAARETAKAIDCKYFEYQKFGHAVFDEAKGYKTRIYDFLAK